MHETVFMDEILPQVKSSSVQAKHGIYKKRSQCVASLMVRQVHCLEVTEDLASDSVRSVLGTEIMEYILTESKDI